MRKIIIAFALFYPFTLNICQDWNVPQFNHFTGLQFNRSKDWLPESDSSLGKIYTASSRFVNSENCEVLKSDTIAFSEIVNPRIKKPFGINTGIRWSPDERAIVTVSANYFIIPKIELVCNLGTDFRYGKHFSFGSRFHFNKKQSRNPFTPFSGLLIGVEYGEGFVQIPAGINYLTNLGFETSLSVNYLIYINSWQLLFAELKIGWRFKL